MIHKLITILCVILSLISITLSAYTLSKYEKIDKDREGLAFGLAKHEATLNAIIKAVEEK